MKKLSLALSALALLGAATSHAVVLFDQLGTAGTAQVGQNGDASQMFEPAFSPGYDVIAVDDFTTTASYSLTNFSFGFEFFNQPTGAPGNSGITGYKVSIYNYGNGTPVTSLNGDVAALTVPTSAATLTTATYGTLASLDLTANKFTLPAGHYYIGVIASNSFSTNGEVGILESTLSTGVPTNARQINPGGSFGLPGNNASLSANLSYRLSASPVPEPSALAALGLGSVALLRRRKRA